MSLDPSPGRPVTADPAAALHRLLALLAAEAPLEEFHAVLADSALTFGAVSGHPLGPCRGRTMVRTSGSLRPFDRGYGQTTVGPMVLPTLRMER